MRNVILAALFVLVRAAIFGQVSEQKLTFNVASVKAHTSGPTADTGMHGGPGTDDPGQIRYINVPLSQVLAPAFNVKLNQVTAPDWIGIARYDVVAKVPAETTKEQLAWMLQNLLKDRFHLVFHREAREESVYNLVVDKSGLKLSDAEPADPAAAGATLHLANSPDGFAQIPAGRPMIVATGSNGITRVAGRMQPIAAIANALEGMARRPIVDKTGLTGNYDFKLEFVRQPSAAAAPTPELSAQDEGGLDLPGAMQKQLGLRLEPAKGIVDHLIIDHLDKTPTEN